jgi:urease accessory protein
VGERSVVTHAYATSPLRLLTPRNHGPAAWVFTSTFGGGMVDGDRLALDVDVAPGATAYLSTQAATKAYKGPGGTMSTLRCSVGAGALLMSMPDPVICFAASRYRQVQQFHLAADAGLVAIDWMTGGRRAAGERWGFDEYYSRTEVSVGGRLLVYDPVALRARDGDLRARLGRFDVLGLAVIAGAMLRAEAEQVVALVHEHAPARGAGELIAAAPLGDQAAPLRPSNGARNAPSDGDGRGTRPAGACGCVVRVAGPSVEAVGATLRRLLHFVPLRLGDDPWRRKW